MPLSSENRAILVTRPWPQVIGSLSLSYARANDAAAVAALLHVAAHSRMEDSSLSEALEFLLEQQTEAGSFGLLADSLEPGRPAPIAELMRLTVEVLWTIAALPADGG
jgi:hypothetical protein